MHRALILVAFGFFVSTMGITGAGADAAEVKPRQEWRGGGDTEKDLPLPKEARARACNVVGKQTFERLWRALRPKEDVPQIDFSKEVVFFATTACARNRIDMTFRLEAGDLQVETAATEMAGPGFAHTLSIVSLNGVKTFTINGEPITGE